MKKLIVIFIFFLCFYNFSYSLEKSIIIKYKVNDDLITNFDIIKEAKYLKALNKELENINNIQINEFAENSLLREKIKQYEIEKYYNVNYSSKVVDNFIQGFMEKLNIENISDFEIYLKDYETNIDEIRKKLVIEQTWNKMIFDIYKNRIVVDEKKISTALEDLIERKKEQTAYELYEIFFSEKTKVDFEKKYNEIILSIKNSGFEKTALLYSMSDTSSSGGKIGWINQNQLSKKILANIKNLEPGSYSSPISTAGGSIILQVRDKKLVSVENIDKQEELSKIINIEKNRQLNEFSIIHFKKTETKSYVKKF